MPSKDNLVKILSEQFNYPKDKVEETSRRLLSSDKRIQNAFISYLKYKTVSSLSIEGYTMDFFIKQHKMNPVAALLSLDWLIREPERAKKIIRRGFDKVSVK